MKNVYDAPIKLHPVYVYLYKGHLSIPKVKVTKSLNYRREYQNKSTSQTFTTESNKSCIFNETEIT